MPPHRRQHPRGGHEPGERQHPTQPHGAKVAKEPGGVRVLHLGRLERAGVAHREERGESQAQGAQTVSRPVLVIVKPAEVVGVRPGGNLQEDLRAREGDHQERPERHPARRARHRMEPRHRLRRGHRPGDGRSHRGAPREQPRRGLQGARHGLDPRLDPRVVVVLEQPLDDGDDAVGNAISNLPTEPAPVFAPPVFTPASLVLPLLRLRAGRPAGPTAAALQRSEQPRARGPEAHRRPTAREEEQHQRSD